jgi:hypothetical protein
MAIETSAAGTLLLRTGALRTIANATGDLL